MRKENTEWHEALFTFWSRLSPIRMRQKELTGGRTGKWQGGAKRFTVYWLTTNSQLFPLRAFLNPSAPCLQPLRGPWRSAWEQERNVLLGAQLELHVRCLVCSSTHFCLTLEVSGRIAIKSLCGRQYDKSSPAIAMLWLFKLYPALSSNLGETWP